MFNEALVDCPRHSYCLMSHTGQDCFKPQDGEFFLWDWPPRDKQPGVGKKDSK